MVFTGWMNEIHPVFGEVWVQRQLHLEHQDEKVFIVRRDNRTYHIMFSERKIVRVDHKLSNEKYFYVESIWPTGTKVVPFIPPISEDTERAQSTETRGEGVTLEAVQKMIQKQKDEIKLEVQEDLNRSHLEIIAEQREINKQLINGLVNNLYQMLQASRLGAM